ncbi:fatty acid desaturase family protein [Polycyclovorans algicola]|uniref:fatty acid desaturase family protein n=1 Tax=Polycyclovorans algicola TaxID=616992 RepID=UPI0004A72C9E|nr:fatty acid desaturase [Polycyclovorans algicola]
MSTIPNPVAAAPRPKLPKTPLYQTPPVAWPTIALFVITLAVSLGTIALAVRDNVHPALAVVILSIAAFVHFTVLHDGVHRSVTRAYPRLNDLIAGISGAFLGPVGICKAFRHVHFAHHRRTNELDHDPDLWSGHGRWWMLPLQWITVDLAYAVRIFRDWRNISLATWVEMVGFFLLLAGGYTAAWLTGWGWEATLYWLIPSRIALPWLAFAFNYLPHHPHEVVQAHNPYAATNVRRGGEPFMRWAFLHQNMHVVHHLFPSVPFYRYATIWAQNRDEWKALGTHEVPWVGRASRA